MGRYNDQRFDDFDPGPLSVKWDFCTCVFGGYTHIRGEEILLTQCSLKRPHAWDRETTLQSSEATVLTACILHDGGFISSPAIRLDSCLIKKDLKLKGSTITLSNCAALSQNLTILNAHKITLIGQTSVQGTLTLASTTKDALTTDIIIEAASTLRDVVITRPGDINIRLGTKAHMGDLKILEVPGAETRTIEIGLLQGASDAFALGLEHLTLSGPDGPQQEGFVTLRLGLSTANLTINNLNVVLERTSIGNTTLNNSTLTAAKQSDGQRALALRPARTLTLNNSTLAGTRLTIERGAKVLTQEGSTLSDCHLVLV